MVMKMRDLSITPQQHSELINAPVLSNKVSNLYWLAKILVHSQEMNFSSLGILWWVPDERHFFFLLVIVMRDHRAFGMAHRKRRLLECADPFAALVLGLNEEAFKVVAWLARDPHCKGKKIVVDLITGENIDELIITVTPQLSHFMSTVNKSDEEVRGSGQ